MDWNSAYTKKNGMDNYMKMVQVKLIWGQGECQWSLVDEKGKREGDKRRR